MSFLAPSLNSWWWCFLENHVYALRSPPPPRKRTRPMEVICVGPPRSGTESLQQALLILGYDHTYHGWDIVFDEQVHSPGWCALARRKWFGVEDGESGGLTAADFDALLGHSVAVTDAAASVFAAEMVAAYPDAKVVLNMRGDEDAWHASVVRTLVRANSSWAWYLASWVDRECFWAWHVYERYMWPLFFRAPDGDMAGAIKRNGKWVYRGTFSVNFDSRDVIVWVLLIICNIPEHCNMIRGLVPKERLLEWDIKDGWKPLCQFLGKDVPYEEFPHANAATGGWKAREQQAAKVWIERAFWRLFLIASIFTAGGWYWLKRAG
ncbi:uncharacterized protein E0L32_005978 [Thyridium curvatum]|uniref:NAD dependent epimerase/dehydratase n=1 Tax=Thyridium curvatum TaxID=1093900 RepID=A0A507B1A9_9PEZI|nr:uncharacterized protein E0L32_005978 [Thyridium curvatum]TPX13507.1 hypothetical protein E0L32_005978 [Thyridium curvatum]